MERYLSFKKNKQIHSTCTAPCKKFETHIYLAKGLSIKPCSLDSIKLIESRLHGLILDQQSGDRHLIPVKKWLHLFKNQKFPHFWVK
jgi:hypothetical protein